jgi:hypothetical protein
MKRTTSAELVGSNGEHEAAGGRAFAGDVAMLPLGPGRNGEWTRESERGE